MTGLGKSRPDAKSKARTKNVEEELWQASTDVKSAPLHVQGVAELIKASEIEEESDEPPIYAAKPLSLQVQQKQQSIEQEGVVKPKRKEVIAQQKEEAVQTKAVRGNLVEARLFAQQLELPEQHRELVLSRLGQLYSYKADLNKLLGSTLNPIERVRWMGDLKECDKKIAELQAKESAKIDEETQKKFSEQQRRDLTSQLDLLYARKTDLNKLIDLTNGPIDRAMCKKELELCDGEIGRLEADLAQLGVKQPSSDKEVRLIEIQQEFPQHRGRKRVLIEIGLELKGDLPALHERKALINDLLSETHSPLRREELLVEMDKCKKEIAALEAEQKSGIKHGTEQKLTGQELNDLRFRLSELYQQKGELQALLDLSIFRPTNQAYYERQVELCDKEIARLEAELVGLIQSS